MKITILGTGPSHRIPRLGKVRNLDKSEDARDTRTFSSMLIEENGKRMLVDCGDSWHQLMKQKVPDVDYILLTNARPDAVLGFYDLVQYEAADKLKRVKLFANYDTISFLNKFFPTQLGLCDVKKLSNIRDNEFEIEGIKVTSFPIKQDARLCSLGFRFEKDGKSFVYTPVVKDIKTKYLKKADAWFTDGYCLSKEKQTGHIDAEEIQNKARIGEVKNVYLVNVGWTQDLTHVELEKNYPHFNFCYDGITFGTKKKEPEVSKQELIVKTDGDLKEIKELSKGTSSVFEVDILAEGRWNNVLYPHDVLEKDVKGLIGIPVRIAHEPSINVGTVTSAWYVPHLRLIKGLIRIDEPGVAEQVIKNKTKGVSVGMEVDYADMARSVAKELFFRELSLTSDPGFKTARIKPIAA